jgi:hypothetical protein
VLDQAEEIVPAVASFLVMSRDLTSRRRHVWIEQPGIIQPEGILCLSGYLALPVLLWIGFGNEKELLYFPSNLLLLEENENVFLVNFPVCSALAHSLGNDFFMVRKFAIWYSNTVSLSRHEFPEQKAAYSWGEVISVYCQDDGTQGDCVYHG